MTTSLQELPPEGLLRAAVDALLAESPAELDPQVALCRARVLQHESERLAAAALAAIADLDERELFALDGAGSTRSWLRQQPAGDQGQLSLARRLRARQVVRAALEAGTIDTRASACVCTALVTVDELEAGTGLGGGLAEDQVHGVLVHAVPQLLQAWIGFDDTGSSELPADDADLRNEVLGRRALLAQVLLDAAEATGRPASERLEPVFTLLARALSPHALADALTTILHALQPERLDSEDEAFEREKHYTLTKRPGRGWDLSAVLDDEDGAWLDTEVRARLKLLTGEHPTDTHEHPDQPEPADQPEHPDTATTRDDTAQDAGTADLNTSTSTGTGTDTDTDLTGVTAPAEADAAAAQPPDAPSPAGPAQPALLDHHDPDDLDHHDPDDPARFGAAGRGVDPLPWDHRTSAPVEGPPHDGAALRTKTHAAFRMLLRDRLAAPGTGSPPPSSLSVVVPAAFLTGQPGAPHPVLDTKRLSELTPAALARLGCDSLISAVILDAAGRPLAASGQHRSFTARERRALRAQWGNTCAANGCGLPGTIPHHVQMFSRTGQTRLADGVPFCEGHHHDVHDGKRTLRLRDGRLLNENGWTQQQQDQAA